MELGGFDSCKLDTTQRAQRLNKSSRCFCYSCKLIFELMLCKSSSGLLTLALAMLCLLSTHIEYACAISQGPTNSEAVNESLESANANGGNLESLAVDETESIAPKLTAFEHRVWLENDAVLFGVLCLILGGVFWTSSSQHRFWKRFYAIIPTILLCYFLPSLLTLSGLADPERSKLYDVAKNYFLPASLILFTLSIDLREVLRLGPKAIVMFLTGTAGVIIGGPLALFISSYLVPSAVGGEGHDAVWRGLTTIAGSWIGGGANQAAMKEVFEPSDALYSVMVAVDVLVAEFWMMFLLLGVGRSAAIDRFFQADASSVQRLQEKMEAFAQSTARIPTTADLFKLLAIAFAGTGLCHFLADILAPWIKSHAPGLSQFSLDSAFFWLVVLATTLGLLASLTPLRKMEGAGASKLGSVCIFLLVATIGLKMDIAAVANHPQLFVVGLIWMAIHVGLMFVVGYFIRAPFFFLAVGSKANIGGAASAPVVAAAFHPSLAPVGVLLAVLGYALGTYGAWISGLMMQKIAGH